MPEIVITEFMDEAAVAGLAADFEVHYDDGLADRPEDLERLAAGCRALIVRNRTQVREPLLAACTRLVVVGRLGVGLDNIDLAACGTRGVEVCPATGANNAAVAEYVVCSVLLLLRRAFHASADVLAGEWPRTRLIGREVGGRRLGLVGFGAIARDVARRMRALGMEVVACHPSLPAEDRVWSELGVAVVTLEELLVTSDAVSLHVPLTGSTRHLIDAAALARMRADAVLINTACGGVVDEAALATALRERRLAGAMLDVFEHESLPAGSPLADAPNLIVTPHIAGVTEESNVRVSAVTAASVRRVLEGRR